MEISLPIMPYISLSSIEKIIRDAGAERISPSACKALRDILEEIGGEISKKAIKLAGHAGRKTVRAEDIKLAR